MIVGAFHAEPFDKRGFFDWRPAGVVFALQLCDGSLSRVSMTSELTISGTSSCLGHRDAPRYTRRAPVFPLQTAIIPVTHIKTRQVRKRWSPLLGEMLIEHTYVDRPASLETWIDHCAALGLELGISALDVHTALFAQFPEIFGR